MPRERITRAQLAEAVAALNRDLGRTPGLPGAYDVVGAYGGWQLVMVGPSPACGAVDHAPVPVGHGYHPRRAIYDAVQSIRHGVDVGRRADTTALQRGTLDAIADMIESLSADDADAVGNWSDELDALSRVQARPTVATLAAERLAADELRAWALGHINHQPDDAADTLADVAASERMNCRH